MSDTGARGMVFAIGAVMLGFVFGWKVILTFTGILFILSALLG